MSPKRTPRSVLAPESTNQFIELGVPVSLLGELWFPSDHLLEGPKPPPEFHKLGFDSYGVNTTYSVSESPG